ncbi:hypothetical protein E0Z10_g9268 [Xylaria hypoxylon]|uniref:Uncharacterized protein n=1 Tax=Xylaria hypoxylon TaxID=37992 RepID=A0A4Z0YPH9_9PEZI|nr:hypothetical protein E0Z10_g9268 [Xylaria hypoxylon]
MSRHLAHSTTSYSNLEYSFRYPIIPYSRPRCLARVHGPPPATRARASSSLSTPLPPSSAPPSPRPRSPLAAEPVVKPVKPAGVTKKKAAPKKDGAVAKVKAAAKKVEAKAKKVTPKPKAAPVAAAK